MTKHCATCGKTLWSRTTSGYCRTHFLGRYATPQLDRFAEQLAEGASVSVAAVTIGLGRSTGRGMLTKLRHKMGWQAQ